MMSSKVSFLNLLAGHRPINLLTAKSQNSKSSGTEEQYLYSKSNTSLCHPHLQVVFLLSTVLSTSRRK